VLILLQTVRGTLGLLAALSLWIPGGLALYLVILPATWIWPSRRRALGSVFVKSMASGILSCLRLGGASFRLSGRIPTEEPILVVGNHQSLLDIVSIAVMSSPHTPAPVARRRYARFVPLVSPALRLVGSPIVDPRLDAKGAIETLRRAVLGAHHGILIFPEGHRTRDGEIRPFRPAGLIAMLEARRLPVYLVVNDGLWGSRRLVELVLTVHRIRGETEVLGPFESPESLSELPEFIDQLRAKMVERLGDMRRRRGPDA
jgi:1-acyl-sn-glycerol-3-phosphate acyltransferase